MIHDTRKDVPAIPMRGTLPELWNAICTWQQQGYGAFVNISDMDGKGHMTENVRASRVAVIDLDNLSAQQNYERAVSWNPPPQFAVNSSQGKYHVYWCVPYYIANDHFTQRQRRLRQLFDGDKRIVDPARVLRLPGTYNLKYESPHLVTCHALAGYGRITTHEVIDAALAHVNVIDGGDGVRLELGEPALAAPSLAWLQRALDLIDPNDLDRGEWISITAAFKQSGWTLTDPDTLMGIWSAWCERYGANDTGENTKQWGSIRNTEIGWPYLVRKCPQMLVERYAPVAPAQTPAAHVPSPAGVLPEPPPLDCSGEYLTHIEQAEWFKGCVIVTELARVMTPDAQFLDSTRFNVKYGGKLFMITSEGKITDEAWKAATRGTQFKIPEVDHLRFIPEKAFGEIITDELDRKGVNTYRPARIKRIAGDPSPFLRHIGFLLPDKNDQKILLDYLAHNVKYPGFKIPWAPVIQSAEGAGKGIIKEMLKRSIGGVYFHAPNAKELAESGSKFNAWMRNKLFILADEIKVDDRRDMIEVLKPMVSEVDIEIQAKGYDQKIEDNYANWMFFTNYKDAVPINKNSRRFAIFFSAFQSAERLLEWGLDEKYFNELYGWMRMDGAAIMADYFMNYPIERGAIPMRAPNTSCLDEVIRASMGTIERLIMEAAEDNVQGFRGGWVSNIAVKKRMGELGLRTMTLSGIEKIITYMGYYKIGRSVKAFFEEDHKSRSTLFHKDQAVMIQAYGPAQEYR